MEMEAKHWFNKHRSGQVMVIVTAGEPQSWKDISERLLPPSFGVHLAKEPLWISLQHRRDAILNASDRARIREEVTEDLKQVLLRFYPGRDWGQLQGDERTQRRRVIELLSATAILLLILAGAAVGFARYAQYQLRLAESRALASRAISAAVPDPSAGLDTAIAAGETAATEEAAQALSATLTNQFTTAVFRHDKAVLRATLSRDGTRLLTASEDGSAHLWDTSNATTIHTFLHGEPVNDADFSPDGRTVATASADVRMWDVDSGRLLRVLSGHNRPILRTSYSPDGKTLATVGADNRVIVWQVDTGKRLHVFECRCEEGWNRLQTHVAYLGNSFLAVKWALSGIHILDVITGEDREPINQYAMQPRLKLAPGSMAFSGLVHSMAENPAGLVSAKLFGREHKEVVSFSPDGSRILVSGPGGPTKSDKLLDGSSGDLLLAIPKSGGTDLAGFSADSQTLVTAGRDHIIRVWGPKRDSPQLLRGHTDEIVDLAVSGNRIVTASRDGSARIWDWSLGSYRTVLALSSPLVASADGSRFAQLDKKGHVHIWSFPEGRLIAQAEIRDPRAAFFSPDNSKLFIVHGKDGGLLIDTSSGRTTATFTHPEMVFAAYYLRGNRLITAGQETSFLWELPSGRRLSELPNSDLERPVAVVSEQSDRLVITGGGLARAVLLQASDGHEISALEVGGDGPTTTAAISPDGQRILVKGFRGNTGMFDAITGHPLEYVREQLRTFDFSPDSSLFVATHDSEEVSVYSVANLQRQFVLKGHLGRVLLAKFSHKDIILTAGDDATLRVWNSRTGQLRHTLKLPVNALDAGLSPDGKGLWILMPPGTVVWSPLTFDGILGLAKSRLQRSSK